MVLASRSWGERSGGGGWFPRPCPPALHGEVGLVHPSPETGPRVAQRFIRAARKLPSSWKGSVVWRRNNRLTADQQLHTLAALAELPADRLTPAELETVFAAAARPAHGEVQMRVAVLLSHLYPVLAPGNPEFAQRAHTVLLRDLRQPHMLLAHPACRWLLTTHLRDENLAHIPWRLERHHLRHCWLRRHRPAYHAGATAGDVRQPVGHDGHGHHGRLDPQPRHPAPPAIEAA